MEVLQRTANRGSISTGLYEIDNSVKMEDANNESLNIGNGNSGQRRTFTVSMWVKRTELGYNRIWGAGVSGNDVMAAYFKDTDDIVFYDYGSSAYRFNYKTNRLFRDTSAFYHLVFAVDTEQGTEANRVRLYVNGVEETSFATQTEPSQNADTNWNSTGNKDIGSTIGENPQFSGYVSEVYFIDDQQLAPTNFGKFDDDTGIWIPKKFSGTFGSKDAFLNFNSSGSMGADSSGNSNNFNLVNITAADQATDTPTNNFAVGNPLNVTPAGIFTQGATRWVSVNGTGMNGAWNLATIAMPAGKWHCEVKCIANDSYFQWGISPTHPNDNFSTRLMYRSDGNIYNAGAGGNTTGHASYTNGDIIGMSYDASANTVIFSKNGTAVVTKTAIANDEPYFFGGTGLSSGTYTGDFNFGGYANYAISSAATDANGYGTFEYAPPSGYLALCTKNLAETGG